MSEPSEEIFTEEELNEATQFLGPDFTQIINESHGERVVRLFWRGLAKLDERLKRTKTELGVLRSELTDARHDIKTILETISRGNGSLDNSQSLLNASPVIEIADENVKPRVPFVTVVLESEPHTLMVDNHTHALLLLARTERTLIRTLLSVLHDESELRQMSITGVARGKKRKRDEANGQSASSLDESNSLVSPNSSSVLDESDSQYSGMALFSPTEIDSGTPLPPLTMAYLIESVKKQFPHRVDANEKEISQYLTSTRRHIGAALQYIKSIIDKRN